MVLTMWYKHYYTFTQSDCYTWRFKQFFLSDREEYDREKAKLLSLGWKENMEK